MTAWLAALALAASGDATITWTPRRPVLGETGLKEQKHIEELLQTIYDLLPHMVKITFQLPLEEQSQRLISQLYDKTKVLHINYGTHIIVEVECNEKIKGKLIAAAHTVNGTVL